MIGFLIALISGALMSVQDGKRICAADGAVCLSGCMDLYGQK